MNNIVDNGHSILSPSGYSTWGNCGGSMFYLPESRRQKTDSEASIQGTVAHKLLESKLHAIDYTHELIDDEMEKIISKVYESIIRYIRQGYYCYSELEVDLTRVLGHPHCNGSSDVVLWKDGHLIVFDLKYGKGINVPVKGNMQLRLYAIGAIEVLGVTPSKVEIVICQPRINERYWDAEVVTDLPEIVETVKQVSQDRLRLLQTKQFTEQDFTPSDKACYWCYGRRTCKARFDHGMELAKEAFSRMAFNNDISNERLAYVAMKIPFIKRWISDVETELKKRVRRGDKSLGFKLAKPRKYRKWVSDDMIPKLIEEGVPYEKAVVIKPASIAQLEKLVDAKTLNKLNKYIEVKLGEPSVVPDTSPVEEYNPLDVDWDAPL